jgi:hypothetical protein
MMTSNKVCLSVNSRRSQANCPDYRAAAILLWGDAGAFVHDCYRHWLHLFPELPDAMPIVIGLSAYGACAGLSRLNNPCLDGPRISIASQYLSHANDVRDVMVHEMLHCWLHVTGHKFEHDSVDWYAAVNRLSPTVLGADINAKRGGDRRSVRVKLDDGTTAVRKERVAGAIKHGDIARWPNSFRPRGWDRGAEISCPTY